jgi:DNA-binding protein Fis/PAS domain-containing protein
VTGRLSVRQREAQVEVDAGAVLNALASPVLVIGPEDRIGYVNMAAEQFFDTSAANLRGRPLHDLIPADSPLFALLEQVRAHGAGVSEHGVTLETPRMGARLVAIQAAPLAELPDLVVVWLHEQSIARKIDRQLTHRNAARSVTAMAALLAHEVKNPLSGIRGAAQLLEQNASDADRELENLIRRLAVLHAEEVVRVDIIEAELADVTAPPAPAGTPEDGNLGQAVEHHLKAYFDAHRGGLPATGLYGRVLREVEGPLISLSLEATRGNQLKAARLLGLNRNTLRKKIRKLDIRVARGVK